MATSLELIHAGPVDYFEIDFSPGYGIYELHGTKGSGKTTVLKSADLLSGRKVDITVTDGELSGEVRGFGVIAPIGGKRRRKGELSVDIVDSEKWSLVDLVDPPYLDEKARDKHRIKAILGLRGVIAEPADFFELIGGKDALESLLPPEKIATDDPVVLASRVKEALESKAREEESSRDHEAGHAKACLENPEGIDTSRLSDSSLLQDAYDKAKERQIELRKTGETFQLDQSRRSEARTAIGRAVNSYTGPTIHEARHASELASKALQASNFEIEDLERALVAARAVNATLKVENAATTAALSAANSHHETCRSWQETIDAAPMIAPLATEIAEADEMVRLSKIALEYGVKVRKVIDDQQRSLRHQVASEESAKRAVRLRELAAKTMDVLTTLVETPSIKVESVEGYPRLVVEHPKRGKTLFDQLSDGERVRYSIDATLIKLAGPALASIPQRIFQDLPPADRLEIHDFCKERKIYGIAAQVTDGDLRVRYLGDGFRKTNAVTK